MTREKYFPFHVILCLIIVLCLWPRSGLLHICNRVMAPDWCKNFVSAQYIENKWAEFHRILYAFILTRSRLGLLLICNRVMGLDWCFHSIFSEQMYRILPNFVYALICTRSTCPFSQICNKSYDPWFISEFRFRSISWEQMNRISSNFIYTFILAWSRSELLPVIFRNL